MLYFPVVLSINSSFILELVKNFHFFICNPDCTIKNELFNCVRSASLTVGALIKSVGFLLMEP